MGRATASALIAAAGATLVLAVTGMRAGIEPFATWFYPFAWYSTLLMIDAAVALRDGRFFFLERPRFAVSLFGWSIPFWLFFELLNLRLANWYYVFVPDGMVARWTGILISFATVLPAIFLAERALRAYGPSRQGSPGGGFGAGISKGPEADSRPALGRISPRVLLALQTLGAACLVLPLLWPQWLFPLVWLGVTLVADPWVYRRDPRRSLLRDLERGRPRRVVRLLVGGMAIGLLWELFNFQARGKWIYTVPGLEELKLFEMPLLGFFGFPFLALEGWSAYQALVLAGLAVDPEREPDDRKRRAVTGKIVTAGLTAALLSALVLRGIETRTISSTTPRLEDLGALPAAELGSLGMDVFDLASASPGDLAESVGTTPERARRWVEEARLATLRGIGTENAAGLHSVGVGSVADLARQNPGPLAARLEAAGHPVPGAWVRIWVRAAVRAVHGRS